MLINGHFGEIPNIPIREIEIGDIIQLSFDGSLYSHSLLVVEAEHPMYPEHILIATHSQDSDYRPLITYQDTSAYRCLKIQVLF